MPVTRRQQILAKIESSEGQNANPTGSDAILVYEPELSQEVDTVERVPAGSSMSRAFDPVGRKKRSVKFTSDFRGSADTTIPITLPEWGTLGQGAGLRPIQPIQIPVTSVSGTLGYQLGEIVQKGSSAIRGVVIGLAIICNLVAGALGGILIPILLEKVKADPAVASGTFVTTVTDVVGFFAFLGLADREGRVAARHGHAVGAQDLLGLVFVDLHGGCPRSFRATRPKCLRPRWRVSGCAATTRRREPAAPGRHVRAAANLAC